MFVLRICISTVCAAEFMRRTWRYDVISRGYRHPLYRHLKGDWFVLRIFIEVVCEVEFMRGTRRSASARALDCFSLVGEPKGLLINELCVLFFRCESLINIL